MMEPVIQLDPERCILVLGPQVAAECLGSAARPPPALSYNMLLEAGVQKMLDAEKGLSNEEKIRKRALLVNAYELDPSFVGNIVVNSLKRNESYSQWLEESFSTISNISHNSNQFVDKLRALQKMGMLLIYTYYDVVLDDALDTVPILMENEEDVQSWANRQTHGILHVHGVHSRPDTVCCNCVNYEEIIGGSKSGRLLREFCKTKTVIFAGFDGEFYDPFMPKFSSTFVDTAGSKQPPLLISCMAKLPNTVSFLTLRIPQMASLERVLQPVFSRQGEIESNLILIHIIDSWIQKDMLL